MSFNIDKKVDMPPIQRNTSKYPFANMAPGDSFHIDGLKEFLVACSAVRSWSRSHDGFTYATRQDADRKGGRIWRTDLSA